MSVLLLAGGSGLIGGLLKAEATRRAWEVRQLERHREAEYRWDPATGYIDARALLGVDAVVCLNGVSLGRRWTQSYKKQLWDSRIDSVATLARAVAGAAARGELGTGPQSSNRIQPGGSTQQDSLGQPRGGPVFLSGSAIGYYGSRADEILAETSSFGTGFLADLCRAWEGANQPAIDAGVRTVALRTGLVMAPEGMMLKLVLPLYKANLGGPLAGGNGWMSSISSSDIARAIFFAMENLSGPVNLVAPEAATNREWNAALAHQLGKIAKIPVPGFAIKAALGEFGREAALASQRVIPRALIEAGFEFAHPNIQSIFAAELN